MSEVKFAPIEVTYIDSVGSDLTVVNAARVSFDKQSCMLKTDEGNLELWDQDKRLINYLAKHKHLSPFNHAFATFRVKAPIFVARQLVKHEYMPWNEVSRRYVDSPPEFYIPDGFREASEDKKQGSGKALPLQDRFVSTHKMFCAHSLEYYRGLLNHGICPEQARGYLPLWAHTEWYWSGSLGAFAKMLSLRLAEDTQYETRIVAQKIYKQLLDYFPISLKALIDNE